MFMCTSFIRQTQRLAKNTDTGISSCLQEEDRNKPKHFCGSAPIHQKRHLTRENVRSFFANSHGRHQNQPEEVAQPSTQTAAEQRHPQAEVVEPPLPPPNEPPPNDEDGATRNQEQNTAGSSPEPPIKATFQESAPAPKADEPQQAETAQPPADQEPAPKADEPQPQQAETAHPPAEQEVAPKVDEQKQAEEVAGPLAATAAEQQHPQAEVAQAPLPPPDEPPPNDEDGATRNQEQNTAGSSPEPPIKATFQESAPAPKADEPQQAETAHPPADQEPAPKADEPQPQQAETAHPPAEQEVAPKVDEQKQAEEVAGPLAATAAEQQHPQAEVAQAPLPPPDEPPPNDEDGATRNQEQNTAGSSPEPPIKATFQEPAPRADQPQPQQAETAHPPAEQEVAPKVDEPKAGRRSGWATCSNSSRATAPTGRSCSSTIATTR